MNRGGDIVQEAVINTILKKKKCKNAKWLSEAALQIAEKRREAMQFISEMQGSFNICK